MVCHLWESDTLGVSLNERKPEDLKVAKLKRWLECRAALMKRESNRYWIKILP